MAGSHSAFSSTTATIDQTEVYVISYNMHGYNQGVTALKLLIESKHPDVIMLQEHWLTPTNLYKFSQDFSGYTPFGCSAMDNVVSSGPLIGRPFGGVMLLLKNELMYVSECIHTSERFIVFKVGDLLLFNVYLPCVGTDDRSLICSNILMEISSWRQQYPLCGCVIGGDFNTDLDFGCNISNMINRFLVDNQFLRCASTDCLPYTFNNEARNYFSNIDYFVYNNVSVRNFTVIEPDINFSDHLPISIVCTVSITIPNQGRHRQNESVEHLRWDRADLLVYYNITQGYLQPILDELLELERSSFDAAHMKIVDLIYERVVALLKQCADNCVPKQKKNFFKFWWSQELDCLKAQAIDSNNLWQAAGRPRSGAIYSKRNSDRRAYRLAIRRAEANTKDRYSNELHDLLLAKDGTKFWKCWNAKFEKKMGAPTKVNGFLDPDLIADSFVRHFKAVCTDERNEVSSNLRTMYNNRRHNYVGAPFDNTYLVDAELVEQMIGNMHRGKAAGLDGLTAEHLIFCHSLLPCILAKLFNLFIRYGHVPAAFGISYTVPLLKGSSSSYSKNLTTDDFRGISISPVISKLFEHCVLRRFESYFVTSDNQFGFKKQTGCSHAIFTVRSVINHYTAHGSTVNLCAVDISKAFDRMNHFGLFCTLMDRLLPVNILQLLEDWFAKCFTCVKWNSVTSCFFQLTRGIRQGGVLSPYLFAVYVDNVITTVEHKRLGCLYKSVCVSIIMYADDIVLLSPSVTALQELLHVCEGVLQNLDLFINPKKSVCMRIGPRYNMSCYDIVSSNGCALQWVESVRYLGVYFVKARQFKCRYDRATASFYRAFNAVFGKIGRSSSEEVVLQLINSKCMPCLLYALEACPINKTQERSLEFTINRVLMKIFRTVSVDVIRECRLWFGIPDIKVLVVNRKKKFLMKYANSANGLCQLFGIGALSEYYS